MKMDDEVTPEPLYRRREFLKNSLLFTATSVGIGAGLVGLTRGRRADAPVSTTTADTLPPATASAFSTTETKTPLEAVTTYNNFYEFGLDKGDPALNAHTLRTRPWTVTVAGEVMKPTVSGIAGIGFFRSAANNPSAASRAFNASNARCSRPTPSSTTTRTIS